MSLEAAPECKLTEEQLDGWRRDGYLVLQGFASPDEVSTLSTAGRELLNSFVPATNPSVFSTVRQTETSDDYFLSSADKIGFFLEEGVLDADGVLNRPKERAVNKIGHALHELDPTFAAWTRKQLPWRWATVRLCSLTPPLTTKVRSASAHCYASLASQTR